MIVNYKQNEAGEKFPYVDVGSEDHGRKSFRLWVSHKLIKKKDEKDIIEFPMNAMIIKTEKGSLILKPSENHITHNIFVQCGYRGSSSFKILEPQVEQICEYRVYESPRGNCGISHGALVTIPKGSVLKYKWKRTGRTYGNPTEGIRIVLENGEEKDFEDVPDGLEALDELKKELE